MTTEVESNLIQSINRLFKHFVLHIRQFLGGSIINTAWDRAVLRS